MAALIFDGPTLCAQPNIVRLLDNHLLAIFVQQVHFLSTIEYEDEYWAVQTNEQWCSECVITQHQLKRIVTKLVALGVIVRQQHGHYDRTAWTRVDYGRLRSMLNATDRTVSKLSDRKVSKPSDVPIREELETRRPTPIAFDTFWDVYPRKVGKPAALRAWKAAADEIGSVMVGLARWLAYWDVRDEPEFIPHPSTWLNQRRWEDDPPPAAKRSKGVMQDTADRIKVPLADSESTLAKSMRKALGEVKGIGR